MSKVPKIYFKSKSEKICYVANTVKRLERTIYLRNQKLNLKLIVKTSLAGFCLNNEGFVNCHLVRFLFYHFVPCPRTVKLHLALMVEHV